MGETAELDKLILMKPACNYSVSKYICAFFLNQVTTALTPKSSGNALGFSLRHSKIIIVSKNKLTHR